MTPFLGSSLRDEHLLDSLRSPRPRPRHANIGRLWVPPEILG